MIKNNVNKVYATSPELMLRSSGSTVRTPGPPLPDNRSIRHERIVFVQYGNFLVDAERLRAMGPETYFAQRYTVDLVESLARRCSGVMVVNPLTGPHDQELCSGVRTVGFPNVMSSVGERLELIRFLEAWQPTTVVVRWPLRFLIAHCLKARWRVLPMLADSFHGNRIRKKFEYWRLARLLNDPRIEVVANHQVPACMDLIRLGVDPAKVVPFDLPCSEKPSDHPIKSSVRSPERLTVMYAGIVSTGKGVGELIEAVGHLTRSQIDVTATIAGNGDIEHFRKLATQLGVSDRVTFAGLVPHAQILTMMMEHDVVVVPSRHDCPEGLPHTISEALVSRSPLVISDHPMFVDRLEDARSALVFPQANSRALADRLRRLRDDKGLYARLSESSDDAWQRLQIPVLWGDLIERWLAGGPEDIQWILSNSMAKSSRF